MPTLAPIDPVRAPGKTKDLLDFVQKRTGRIPNLVMFMANSPAALGGYLNFASAFHDAVLAGDIRDLIGVTVAERSGCDYTLSAVCALARSGGRSEGEIAAARSAQANDAKTAAALQFAAKIVDWRGHLRGSDVAALRANGFSDGEICDIVATVVLNVYRSYFNLIVDPEIDFPVVRAGSPAA
jgi:alkylhydroperoxidase family enzyme